MEQLNQEKNLLERFTLLRKVDELTTKAEQTEKDLKEMSQKYDITERNLSNDNRQLRGKIHSMEKEILLLRDRTVSLDEIIKVISSNLILRKKTSRLHPCQFIDIMPFIEK